MQRLHHIRVIGVVFATMHVFEQAASCYRLPTFPGLLRQMNLLSFQISKAGALNAADCIAETEIHHLIMQSHDFKQLGATITVDRGNSHLGDDFIQAFIDALAVIFNHRQTITVRDFPGAD